MASTDHPGPRWPSGVVPALFALGALALLPAAARACSVCGCGDPLLDAADPAASLGLLRLQLEGEYLYRLSIATKEAERQRIESNGIKAYNDSINASLTPSVLSWHGIQATRDLAKSPNAKVVVVGAGKNGLPLILGKD